MKRSSARAVSLLLRRIARELDHLSDEEIASLVDSPEPLFARMAHEKKEKPGTPTSSLIPESVITRLRSMETREAGLDFLKSASLTRDELARVAKAVDLPVTNRHKIDEILQKIVEATIGFRVRSAAILGAEASSSLASGAEQVEHAESPGHPVKGETKSAPKKQR